ncbi:uncharacterized protein CDV56_101069 [Aspergillus thermomutatus]|uniref:Uncharacterized protein n=1 Tax=Aspergillus thermomutatus TaxID=41047 RepID=A0A397FZB9_ASPTH|nr:uncharacterized protein CDV56_101069 [Aspergillus thermomutatus]RHZ43887.1 hypothetical protein CDV56_101069 [Aspergillus thermomutatus]
MMMKCANEIYVPAQETIVRKWQSATIILDELRNYEETVIETFGFGLQLLSDTGHSDVRKTILTTLHLNTVIITLRPFIILRGKLRRKQSENANENSNPFPRWLDGACEFALQATRQLVHYLYVAITENYTVKAMLFNHVFLENCCAVLIYEILHDRTKASDHLPCVYQALHSLLQMRDAKPIQHLICILQKLLHEVHPSESDQLTYRQEGGRSRHLHETLHT